MRVHHKQLKHFKNKEQIKLASINGIHFFHNNEVSAHDIYNEVFIDKIYDFQINKLEPVIIDAGSNIGLSMLFFKKQFPNAKITCFEPDPYIFPILSRNIALNHLDDVKTLNAALSKKIGYVRFYGEFGCEADARGNSIIDIWGKQRKTSNSILVKALPLSSFITQEIDLLKLDIEGAEQQVLEELGNKLLLVKNILIEVHEAKGMNMMNSIRKVVSILEKYGFDLTITEVDIRDALPIEVDKWSRSVSPKLFMVKGTKIEN